MKKHLLLIIALSLTLTACKESAKEDPVPVQTPAPRAKTTIEFNEPGAVLESSVVFSGLIHQKDPSIKEYGVVYSKNPEVDIKTGTKIVFGPEVGDSYRMRVNGLEEGTKYYAKAYLIHEDNVVNYSQSRYEGNVYPFETAKSGSWARLYLPFRPDFSTGFFIGDILYIIPNSYETKRDLRTYDLNLDLWTSKGEIPFSPRKEGNAFSYNGKGYLMLGAKIDNSEKFDEVWEYDPATKVWTKKASCPVKMSAAAGFLLNGKYYVTRDSRGGEIYEYDIAADTWTKKGAILEHIDNMSWGNSFVYNGKGYIYSTSIWPFPAYNFAAYDPVNNSWSYIVAPIPGYQWSDSQARNKHLSVLINNKIYTALGDNKYDMYSFDMITEEWQKIGKYPAGSLSSEAMAVNYGNKILLLDGFTGYVYIPAK
ncbi:hypothetical protein JAO76_11685 [Pontibacter sp. BT310]|uniref:Galactose oxidase n=1 Tax=Pontibacter populi TaxID=890055 RepID=A0ABS6XCJ0_9BACT|nr:MULTISPECIES: hypothetical protein [Pontibacter]MBJ6118860.1 hypothetical protein [Pontibacter sp. BT310]MBR0571288.1 hypothetical protein [Microvirga sp. STS03]MBW3365714.1 hypothetical protein [Pontibacter populi]